MKPVSTAFVKIWGHVVGAVAWLDREKYAVFEFEPEFLKQGLDLAPIHMSLTGALQGKTKFAFPGLDGFSFHGLPGLLSGSLPDRWGTKVINAWLAQAGTDPSSFNPVERLCLIGTRGMGALEFSPQVNPGSFNRTTRVQIKDLMALAQDIIFNPSQIPPEFPGEASQQAQSILSFLNIAGVVGGTTPKVIIAMDEQEHLITGQTSKIQEGSSHWILKFDGVTEQSASLYGDPLGQGRVEYAYSMMAKAAGIQVVESQLFEEGGRAHLLARRFDRDKKGRKLHMQTLGAMAHFGWNPPGRYGYEHVFQVLRKIGIGKTDQEELFRRMVFNAVARNTDDHIKSFSFLMDDQGRWKLSPAYGLTYSYNPTSYLGSRHSLSINGKKRNFTLADFLAVADAVEISRPKRIIDEVLTSIQSWPDFALDAKVNQERTQFIGEEHLVHSIQK